MSNAISAVVSVFTNILDDWFGIEPPKPPANNLYKTESYALRAADNDQRVGESLALPCGKIRMLPDVAVAPYYINARGTYAVSSALLNVADDIAVPAAGAQILCQGFSFGVGDIDVSDWQIGGTPIGEFSGVVVGTADYACEELGPIVSGGCKLFNAGTGGSFPIFIWGPEITIEKKTDESGPWGGATTLSSAHAVNSGWFRVCNNTAATIWAVHSQQVHNCFRRSPQIDLSCANVEGAQLANDSDSVAGDWHTRRTPPNTWQVILNLSGTVYATSGGNYASKSAEYDVQIRPANTANAAWQDFSPAANSEGAAAGGYTRSGATCTVTNNTPDQLRWSMIGLIASANADAKGEYDVRIRRKTIAQGGGSTIRLNWDSMVSRRVMPAPIPKCNLHGLIALASSTLSGSMPAVSAIAERRVLVGNSWVKSQKPGEILADFIRGRRGADGALIYGLGQEPDADQITALDKWASAKSLTCDGVITGGSALQIMRQIARCAEGGVDMATGKIGCSVDAADQAVAAHFTEDEILENSLSIEKSVQQPTDKLTIEYADSANAYGAASDTLAIATTHHAPEQREVDGWGIITAAQAQRRLQIEKNKITLRADLYRWDASSRAINLSAGDVVTLSHARYGLSNKRLKIVSVEEREGALFTLSARPDPASYYP